MPSNLAEETTLLFPFLEVCGSNLGSDLSIPTDIFFEVSFRKIHAITINLTKSVPFPFLHNLLCTAIATHAH
jgi:hypothetical protein